MSFLVPAVSACSVLLVRRLHLHMLRAGVRCLRLTSSPLLRLTLSPQHLVPSSGLRSSLSGFAHPRTPRAHAAANIQPQSLHAMDLHGYRRRRTL